MAELSLSLGFFSGIVSGIPVSNILRNIGNGLPDILNGSTDILRCVSSQVAHGIRGSADSIANVLSSASDSITDAVEESSDSAASLFNSLTGSVADVLYSLPSPVTYSVRSSRDCISNIGSTVSYPVANILSSASNSITNAVEEATDAATSLFSGLTDSITDILSCLTDGIANVLGGVLNVTCSIADPLTSAVEETRGTLFSIGSCFRGGILYIIRSTANPLAGAVEEALSAFSGLISSTRYSVTYVLSSLADSVAYVLCHIDHVFTSSGPQCNIRCFLGSLAYSVGNIACSSGNLLPRSVVVLCLVGVCGSSEIFSEFMIAIALSIHTPVVHLIAHSLVFLHLAVDSFGTIGIRLAGVPVCNVLCHLASSVAYVLRSLTDCVSDLISSSGNSSSKILCGRTTVTDGLIDNAINSFSGCIRNILKGFSSILSGLP